MIVTTTQTRGGFDNSLSLIKNFFLSLFKNSSCSLQNSQAKKIEKTSQSTAVITKDKKYLDQYYALRQGICKEENGWETYDGSENHFDKNGDIIVILDANKKVVGGARFMISDSSEYLYSEIPNSEFTYKNVFSKIGIDSKSFKFAEISSFVIESSFRDRSGTEVMLQSLIKKALSHNCKYIVGISSMARCRNYKIVFNKLGYELKIVKEFLWMKRDIYNYVETFLMIVKI